MHLRMRMLRIAHGGNKDEICDICGSDRTEWRKCKLVCLNCGSIVKSCSDQ